MLRLSTCSMSRLTLCSDGRGRSPCWAARLGNGTGQSEAGTDQYAGSKMMIWLTNYILMYRYRLSATVRLQLWIHQCTLASLTCQWIPPACRQMHRSPTFTVSQSANKVKFSMMIISITEYICIFANNSSNYYYFCLLFSILQSYKANSQLSKPQKVCKLGLQLLVDIFNDVDINSSTPRAVAGQLLEDQRSANALAFVREDLKTPT